MNHDQELDTGHLEVKLQAITAQIWALAHSHQGDCVSLLALLRALEHLHNEIRENLFQSSLPDNRRALYTFLRDIEESGGWPYIDRMKLQSLLSNLPEPTDTQTMDFSQDQPH